MNFRNLLVSASVCLLVLTAFGLPVVAQADPEKADTTTSSNPDSDFSDALDSVLNSDSDLLKHKAGDVTLRLVDLSADLLFAVGGSTERDESLQSLQGGGHDPRKRGFTLQNLEIGMKGAVDPYFQLDTFLIYYLDPLENESVFELEEAFLTTQQLPFGLEENGFEIEAGQSFTEFGRINTQHPHSWDWLDQPVINTRLFGPDGMRGLGARLGWLAPIPDDVPWFAQLHFGVQNAHGETMASFLANDEFFEERPIGGRGFEEQDVRNFGDLAYLLRLENSVDTSDDVTTVFGLSGLAGPNATGDDGCTLIYGADLLVEWTPTGEDRCLDFLRFQAEIMRREYEAESFFDGVTTHPHADLNDWGFYTQVLAGFPGDWAAGFRYECARGSGPSVDMFPSRSMDPFRDNRQRFSPLVIWQATHFSRIRLQYNYDVAQHLEDDHAHSFWIGFEVLIGKHPAHKL